VKGAWVLQVLDGGFQVVLEVLRDHQHAVSSIGMPTAAELLLLQGLSRRAPHHDSRATIRSWQRPWYLPQ